MATPELACEVHEGRGPPLLLVHGMLSSRAQWSPNLAALAAATRPVVVELWGHGGSPAPDDPALYHPDAYVDAFEAIRRRLGAGRWLVCGQSLGAALTLRYTLAHPDRVSAQVFTNSSSALADKKWSDGIRAAAPAQAAALEAGGRPALERIPVHPAHAKRLPAGVRDALVRDAKRHDPRGVAWTLRYTTPDSSLRARIGENRVPTLLVCGEREERFDASRRYAETHMPGLEVVGAPAGHAVNLEAAGVFNRAVPAFFRRALKDADA